MAEKTSSDAAELISFGPYRLFPRLRRLERAGDTIELGSRAFDILCTLAERSGEIVTNRDLMRHVWGNVVVGEGSLRFHINALRKALAQDGSRTEFVKNVARRGYAFIPPVRRTALAQSVRADTSAVELGKLPRRPARVVGRTGEIQEIAALLRETRFVTLVGFGGVGKSTVALEVAHVLREQFDQVRFVDLETTKDAAWVASAVASALGLVVSSANPVASLSAYLRDKRVLLIFDSCERVLEAAAMLAERIFDGSPRSAILATSQEALRADGERAYALGPLRVPAEDAQLTPEEAVRYPAIQLFVSRARETDTHFDVTETNVVTISAICRRVDGIPLAIELAAGRVGTLALPTILRLLNSQFALTWPGRRTAAERQRTLGAAIAWTVKLLDEHERALLRRLAVFSGPFTLEAAQRVCAGSGLPVCSVPEALSNLVAKSLAGSSSLERSTHHSNLQQATHFWLLGVTHAFASTMLEESGEFTEVAQRHATYLCALLERTYAGSSEFLHAEAWRSHAACLTNVRSALDWALRHQDRTDVLLRLAAAASPFLLDLSLLSEGARWASIGLGVVEGRRGSSQELELQASLGMSLLFSRGSLEEVQVALTRGLVLADERLDRYNQMRLIGALSNFHQRTGELERSLQLAERAKVVAQSLNDPVCSAMADWLMGTSSHLVGNHATARRVCERAWSSSSHSSLVKRVRFGFDDHRIRALCGWARSLWLLGQVDDARGAVPRVMQEAERFGHPIALSVALAWLTPVWFWTGEWHVAEEYAARLVAHAEQHSSAVYRAVGRGLQGELAVERGDASEGLLLLQDALNVLQHSRFSVLQAVYADPLARALARLGRFDEALAAIDGALQASERKGRSFALPELLRVKGSLLAEQARDTPVEAERLLRQAYELARQQGALSLQLRSAMSLATSNAIAPTESAQKLLRETYVQFSQGLETRDLILAGRWLDLSRSNAG